MTETNNDAVFVRLRDRKYQVKCPPEKIAELQEAANYLDIKMREVSEGNKVSSLEGLVVIAALNITHELVHLQKQKTFYIETMHKRILDLQNKIDAALV